jgi:DNA-binding response OmpR family regulator
MTSRYPSFLFAATKWVPTCSPSKTSTLSSHPKSSAERPSDVREIPLPGVVADLARYELRYDDGRRMELSEKEADLLRYLASNPGRAISREELLERVWQINPRGLTTRTIDMHVTRLREKLHDSSDNPQIVLTVRGKGYMFAVKSN